MRDINTRITVILQMFPTEIVSAMADYFSTKGSAAIYEVNMMRQGTDGVPAIFSFLTEEAVPDVTLLKELLLGLATAFLGGFKGLANKTNLGKSIEKVLGIPAWARIVEEELDKVKTWDDDTIKNATFMDKLLITMGQTLDWLIPFKRNDIPLMYDAINFDGLWELSKFGKLIKDLRDRSRLTTAGLMLTTGRAFEGDPVALTGDPAYDSETAVGEAITDYLDNVGETIQGKDIIASIKRGQDAGIGDTLIGNLKKLAGPLLASVVGPYAPLVNAGLEAASRVFKPQTPQPKARRLKKTAEERYDRKTTGRRNETQREQTAREAEAIPPIQGADSPAHHGSAFNEPEAVRIGKFVLSFNPSGDVVIGDTLQESEGDVDGEEAGAT